MKRGWKFFWMIIAILAVSFLPACGGAGLDEDELEPPTTGGKDTKVEIKVNLKNDIPSDQLAPGTEVYVTLDFYVAGVNSFDYKSNIKITSETQTFTAVLDKPMPGKTWNEMLQHEFGVTANYRFTVGAIGFFGFNPANDQQQKFDGKPIEFNFTFVKQQ